MSAAEAGLRVSSRETFRVPRGEREKPQTRVEGAEEEESRCLRRQEKDAAWISDFVLGGRNHSTDPKPLLTLIFRTAAILTILSITLPRWVLYHDSTPHGHDLSISLGLDKRCVIDGNQRRCSPFPGEDECHASERGFCTLWRSIGFLMNTAVLGELVLIVVFVVLLAGGRGKREKGWKLAAGLVMLVGEYPTIPQSQGMDIFGRVLTSIVG